MSEVCCVALSKSLSTVVFASSKDGYLIALDSSNGKPLWRYQTGGDIRNSPISYSVDGKQYIAVMTGLGGGSPRNVPAAIAPDIKIPQSGQALYIFSLP